MVHLVTHRGQGYYYTASDLRKHVHVKRLGEKKNK